MTLLLSALPDIACWCRGPECHRCDRTSCLQAATIVVNNNQQAPDIPGQVQPVIPQQPAAAPQSGPCPMSAGPHCQGVPADYQAVPPDAQPQSAYKDLAPCTDHTMRAPQHLMPAMSGLISGGTPAHYVAGLDQHHWGQQGSHPPPFPASRTQPQAQWPSSFRLDQVESRPVQIAVQGPLDAGSAGGFFAAHTSVQQSADLDRYSFNILCFALQHLRTGLCRWFCIKR